LATIEFKQLLTAAFGRLHGTAESRVEKDERRARQQVDEDDTKPEVDVEVDVQVRQDERREVELAADDRRVWVNVRRQLESLDTCLNKPSELRQQCRRVHTDNHLHSTHRPHSAS